LRSATAGGSKMRTLLDGAVLKETGAKVLWWQAYGRNIYLNNGSAIRMPADLKGKKVRVYGKMGGWTVEAMGGAPTIMSGSKQFLAYQQKAVDVGLTGTSGVKSRKLYEVMDHMTLSYDFAIEFVAIINNDFFNSLSKKNQQIIIKAARKVETDLRNEVYSGEAKIVDELRSKMTVVELSSAERAAWKKATASVVDRFIKENGNAGLAAVEAARNP
jgi:C4-dicarboxylate-binding protein DctP